jgi:hypothetical protein
VQVQVQRSDRQQDRALGVLEQAAVLAVPDRLAPLVIELRSEVQGLLGGGELLDPAPNRPASVLTRFSRVE